VDFPAGTLHAVTAAPMNMMNKRRLAIELLETRIEVLLFEFRTRRGLLPLKSIRDELSVQILDNGSVPR
jgi:hypothetical protein